MKCKETASVGIFQVDTMMRITSGQHSWPSSGQKLECLVTGSDRTPVHTVHVNSRPALDYDAKAHYRYKVHLTRGVLEKLSVSIPIHPNGSCWVSGEASV